MQGMCLLTLTVSVPSLKPPPCTPGLAVCDKKASPLQLGLFFTGLYILAIGTGGTKPNISTIGADQFDDFEPKERGHKLSFFNWWMFSIFFGTLFANTFLVYIQDNVGWAVGYGLPTLGLAISIAIFLVGVLSTVTSHPLEAHLQEWPGSSLPLRGSGESISLRTQTTSMSWLLKSTPRRASFGSTPLVL